LERFVKKSYSQKTKYILIIGLSALVLVAVSLAYGIKSREPGNESNKQNESANKPVTVKDVKSFAPNCSKIDVKNATKIFNSGEVELVASGVSRQETVRLIQENCTLSVSNSEAKEFYKISISFATDKTSSQANQKVKQLEESLKVKNDRFKAEKIEGLGDIGVYQEFDISGANKQKNISIKFYNKDTLVTILISNTNLTQGKLGDKDKLIQFAKELI